MKTCSSVNFLALNEETANNQLFPMQLLRCHVAIYLRTKVPILSTIKSHFYTTVKLLKSIKTRGFERFSAVHTTQLALSSLPALMNANVVVRVPYVVLLFLFSVEIEVLLHVWRKTVSVRYPIMGTLFANL